MNYFVAVQKAGRCASGAHRDHGVIRHAYNAEQYHFGVMGKALCNTAPGRRSVGFVADKGEKEITCKTCLKRLEKIDYNILDVDSLSGDSAVWDYYLSDDDGNETASTEATSFNQAEVIFKKEGKKGSLITAAYGSELVSL